MNMMRVLTTIAAAMLLAGCASTDTRAAGDNPTDKGAGSGATAAHILRSFNLLLRVDNNNQLVVTNEKSAACQRFDDTDQLRKGCIVANQDEMVDITVRFTGSPGWYFSKFRICRADDQNPQKPGFGSVCTLSDIDRAAWLVETVSGVAIPGTDGLVDINPSGDGAFTEFQVQDQNLTVANYFYGIEACNGQKCLWTDPGVQNNGRGWP